MPKNQHFIFTNDQVEKILYSDLKKESIEIYGDNVYYISCSPGDYDNITNRILGQDPFQNFKNASLIVVYPENIDGFSGQKEQLSKFGFNLMEQNNFLLHKDEFKITGLSLPKPGDLLYWPITHRLFMINFVDFDYQFNQLGDNCVWQLQTELFKYSSEKFETNIQELDQFNDFMNNDSTENEPIKPDNEDLSQKADELLADELLS